ncbi:MAG: TRAP transporter permease [Deltaproteobacteria bacterium]|nr:TRAP transporter permease [Deltaproteobacteria bacterium]
MKGAAEAVGFMQGWNARRAMVWVLALAMALFHLYASGVRALPGVQQRSVHLAFAMALIFLMFPFKTKEDEAEEAKVADENRPLSVVDLVLVFLSVFVGGYVFSQFEAISFRTGMPSVMDTVCSTVAILLVLEATRRVIGWSIIVLCVIGFAYLAFGSHLPPSIAHTGFGFQDVANFMFFSTEGILGLPLGVSSTVIATFIIFGAFLVSSGAGSFVIDLGLAFFGKYRGGPAKAAVIGSCCFGAITGSQLANVAAVGVLTIPLMKRVGYRPMVAASVEALASTGGMLVPPVMGAVAFIIPEMIGGSYWDVCRAALIPGLLFYTSVYMVVELQAAKYGLVGLPKEELPRARDVFLSRGHMLTPLLALIVCITWFGYSTQKAGAWAVVVCILASQLRSKTRMTLPKIATALEKGAKGTLIVAACCASAGLITGAISMTGLGLRFSDVLVSLAGGNVILMLLLAMIASLILGLPLPPVTCYLMLAVLAAPALIKAGVHPMAAHLFVFFFGALGNISPPVAPTSFAAAGIAESDPVKTTNLTFLYSLPSFLVPYLYVYSNELLLIGPLPMVLLKVVSAFVGISCMAVTFHGFLFRNIGWLERSLFLLGGLLIVYPHGWTMVAGYALIALLTSVQFFRTRSQRALSVGLVEKTLAD